jgi:dihydrofolate reductase
MIATAKLSLIVARAQNGVIGVSGRLPWRLKSDMAFFRQMTMGKPVIMGRKTWESLPQRPLKGRDNIVMTRDWTYDAPGARVYASFAAASNAARAIAARNSAEEAFVIGGEALYAMSLPMADRLYLTEVEAAPDGDAFFPAFDASEWNEVAAERFEASDGNEFAFTIRRLDRIHAAMRMPAK